MKLRTRSGERKARVIFMNKYRRMQFIYRYRKMQHSRRLDKIISYLEVRKLRQKSKVKNIK